MSKLIQRLTTTPSLHLPYDAFIVLRQYCVNTIDVVIIKVAIIVMMMKMVMKATARSNLFVFVGTNFFRLKDHFGTCPPTHSKVINQANYLNRDDDGGGDDDLLTYIS